MGTHTGPTSHWVGDTHWTNITGRLEIAPTDSVDYLQIFEVDHKCGVNSLGQSYFPFLQCQKCNVITIAARGNNKTVSVFPQDCLRDVHLNIQLIFIFVQQVYVCINMTSINLLQPSVTLVQCVSP